MKFENDQTVTSKTSEALDLEKLNRYFNTYENIEPIVAIRQFPGGFSNLTYLLLGEKTNYVLRKPPKGAEAIKGGHNMAREYLILKKLEEAGFSQIPRPLLLCEDESIVGSIFYLMEKKDGVILRAKDATTLLKSGDQQLIRKISESICLNQVALHKIDIKANGLTDIGKTDGYVERQVHGWINRYYAAQTESILAMDDVANWMKANIPISTKATLLHNDYKYDNLILNPDQLSNIIAILDWEMASVGDPLMDLGSTLAYWVEQEDEPFGRAFNISWLPGNLSRQAYADLYARETGTDISNLIFYYIFGLFKNSVIIQQIYSRYKKGLTTDARFAKLIEGVFILSTKAVKSIEQHRMC